MARPNQGDRSKLNRIKADREELKLLRERGELCLASEVRRIWCAALLKWREMVNQSSMPAKEKTALLEEMSKACMPTQK